jgi:hypothetical protein
LKVDRYKSDREPNLYLLVAYNESIPSFEKSAGTFAAVGAAETRSYSDALCNEIEEAIRSRGYWIGELPADT